MPTLKPRVQVTLEPATHEVIERLAALQGCSRGAVIADFIDSVAPALGRTVALLEAARDAPEQVRQGLIDVVNDLHGELLEVTGEASKEVQLCLDRLGDPAWQPPTSGSVQSEEKGGAQVLNPHVVTRGSGSGEPGGPIPHQTHSNPVTARVPASTKGAKGQRTQKPKGTSAKSPQEAAEDAEFDAAYRGMIEAAEDHKQAREELRQEILRLRSEGGKDAQSGR
jgi:hypothetical protein